MPAFLFYQWPSIQTGYCWFEMWWVCFCRLQEVDAVHVVHGYGCLCSSSHKRAVIGQLLLLHLPDWHVRTPIRKMETARDKHTMLGGGSKQCAAIALLLSVCLRCHVTQVFNTIKKSPPWFRTVCVCVCLLWQRLPCDWLYWTCSNKAKHTTGAASNYGLP